MPSIHPSAWVDSGVKVPDSATVGPFAVVEEGAEIGESVTVGPHAVVHGSATLHDGVRVGAHAVLGADPQSLGFDPEVRTRVVIGARSVLREGATVSRATGDEPTRVGADCLLMGQVHIGHDCVLGDGVVVSQGAGLAGHVTVGEGAVIGGMAGVHQHVRVGRLAMVGGAAVVTRDVPPFLVAMGKPARLAQINRLALTRAGVDDARQRAVRRVFLALQNRAPAEAEGAADPLAAELLTFWSSAGGRGTTAFLRG
ncbi:acyl-ACP--UDP-N-acetylglucosamine O-acyltransferase [Streptomyces sp. NPDC026672]|uniref:acyl-ACP--UDP-N-acetylglucosamine O-acyltransferase n=1 Tax=unclassified Streptomyces TaxID=2593676 RepID=UPI003407C5CA